jgi:uncharacterized protein DUF6282
MDSRKRARAAMEAAIDLHVHVAPSRRPRYCDSQVLAEQAALYGMRGFLLKDHDRTTVTDAWFAQKAHPDVLAASSVCLNAPSGGINLAAARASIAMGARAVFLPTESAANSVQMWSRHQAEAIRPDSALDRAELEHGRIGLLDPDGNLLPTVVELVRLCADSDVLLCTGHISGREVDAVVAQAASQRGRVCVTHAPTFTECTIEQLRRWAAAGAFLELAALMCCSPYVASWIRRSYQMDAELIDAVGASSFVLSSDLGQADNVSPAEGLCQFVDGLLAEGISVEDLHTMTSQNPQRALGGAG